MHVGDENYQVIDKYACFFQKLDKTDKVIILKDSFTIV